MEDKKSGSQTQQPQREGPKKSAGDSSAVRFHLHNRGTILGDPCILVALGIQEGLDRSLQAAQVFAANSGEPKWLLAVG